MPTFAYQARNKDGQQVHGKQEASDKRAALLALREAGLFVTQLNALAAAKTSAQEADNAAGNWWWRAKPKDMSLYFRQMYAMLHGGTSLAAALGTMTKSAPNKRLREASLEMSRNVAKGKTWSEEMRRYPGLFSPLMLAMIHSGEVGGFLDSSCGKLADYSEKDHHIQQVIARETWYPKLVVFAAILLGNAPILFITYFTGGTIGAALRQFAMGVFTPLAFIFAIWFLFNLQKFFAPLARHLKPLLLVTDQIKLLFPVMGKTVRQLAISKFCRTFAALNMAGVSVDGSFNLAADACGNAVIAEHVKKVIPAVQSGQGITDSLASTRQFQPVVLQMMRTGEVSGEFEKQLESVADFMEQESETTIHKSMMLLGVLALIIVGIMVGFQVIHFYTGYFNSIFEMANG